MHSDARVLVACAANWNIFAAFNIHGHTGNEVKQNLNFVWSIDEVKIVAFATKELLQESYNVDETLLQIGRSFLAYTCSLPERVSYDAWNCRANRCSR